MNLSYEPLNFSSWRDVRQRDTLTVTKMWVIKQGDREFCPLSCVISPLISHPTGSRYRVYISHVFASSYFPALSPFNGDTGQTLIVLSLLALTIVLPLGLKAIAQILLVCPVNVLITCL